MAARGQRERCEVIHGSSARVSLSFSTAMKNATEEKRKSKETTGAGIGYDGSHRPQSAGAPLSRFTLQQAVRQAFPSEDSPRSPLSYDSSHQALGLDLAADHRAGRGRGDPSRQKGGSSVRVCPSTDQRSAPQRQDSALPRSDSHRRGSERSETNRDREPGLKGRSTPVGAREPLVEDGHQPQNMSYLLRLLSKDAASSSSASKVSRERPGSSTPKRSEQGKVEALESDKTLTKTNSLEAELKALRISSHPQSSQFRQALERPVQIMNELLAENQQLQKELNNIQALQVRPLQAEVKRLQQELHKQQDSKGVSEHHLVAVNRRLHQELQELRDLKNVQEALLSSLQDENQELREELEEVRRQLVPESETTADEMPVPQMTTFPVQVRISGETGGYEKQFLGDVTKLLAGHKVSLQVEEYQEDSGHLLLLFSTIAYREGTAMDNAVNGLKSMQKTLLIVLHYKRKNNTKFFPDIKPQVPHPALVGTVHACFSKEDGFYHCQTNQDAVESVAATIRQLMQDS